MYQILSNRYRLFVCVCVCWESYREIADAVAHSRRRGIRDGFSRAGSPGLLILWVKRVKWVISLLVSVAGLSIYSLM